MNNPEVSIIITTFNYDKYVARAIRSCIEQSFLKRDFEIIVIDDSSKDSTKYILQSYGHWIQTIEHTENKGLPHSRNEGIECAKGKYIVNLDADDYLHPDFIKICYLHMTLNECDAAAADYILVDDNEKPIKRINVNESPIACGIMLIKNNMLDVGLYDTSLQIGEDIDFRLRYEKKYKISRVNLPLYKYRMHKKNKTSDKNLNKVYLDKVSQKNNCVIDHSYFPEKF